MRLGGCCAVCSSLPGDGRFLFRHQRQGLPGDAEKLGGRVVQRHQRQGHGLRVGHGAAPGEVFRLQRHVHGKAAIGGVGNIQPGRAFAGGGRQRRPFRQSVRVALRLQRGPQRGEAVRVAGLPGKFRRAAHQGDRGEVQNRRARRQGGDVPARETVPPRADADDARTREHPVGAPAVRGQGRGGQFGAGEADGIVAAIDDHGEPAALQHRDVLPGRQQQRRLAGISGRGDPGIHLGRGENRPGRERKRAGKPRGQFRPGDHQAGDEQQPEQSAQGIGVAQRRQRRRPAGTGARASEAAARA